MEKGTEVRDIVTGELGYIVDAGGSWVDIRWNEDTTNDGVELGVPTWRIRESAGQRGFEYEAEQMLIDENNKLNEEE